MTVGLDRLGKEAEILFALRGIIDPEIGLSVVDVGLIYGVQIDGEGTAIVTMTTTTRGCPATEFLVDAVRERAMSTAVARVVVVRLTYDPPWSPDMMAQ